MKNAMVALAVVIGVAANAAEKFALQPVSISGGKEDAAATPGEVVTVKARGVGANKVEALKDAYRDAVERAVGLYVDAEQIVENDKVIKDQILTQSNAYIEKFEVIGKELCGELVKVRILAQVRCRRLEQRIEELMRPVEVQGGSSLAAYHAMLETQKKRDVDAAVLLENALQGLHPVKLLDCNVLSGEAVVAKSWRGPRHDESIGASDSRICYPISLTINEERYYKSLVPVLRNVLGQISLSPPVRFEVNAVTDDQLCLSELNPKGLTVVDGRWQLKGRMRKIRIGGWRWPHSGSGSVKDDRMKVSIVVGKNRFGTIYNAELYEIDAKSASVFRKWHNSNYKLGSRFKIQLLGEEGEVLCSNEFSPDGCYGCFENRCCRYTDSFGLSEGSWDTMIVVPWFVRVFAHPEGCVENCDWAGLVVKNDVLPFVKKVRISPVAQ